MGKFVICQSVDGYRFLLENYQGEIIGISEYYETEKECKKCIHLVSHIGIDAPIEDTTGYSTLTYEGAKYVIFRDNNDMYRYNLLDENGNKLLSSTGYTSFKHCVNSITKLRRVVHGF